VDPVVAVAVVVPEELLEPEALVAVDHSLCFL
jgi:hypothetical protein